MVLATDALHLGWVCACSELTCALSFAIGVRSQGSFDAEVSGVSPSPASPRRGCLSVKHPARPASSSTSATKDWSFSAPYIRTKRRFCPSPRLSPQKLYFQTTKLHRHFSVPLKQRARYSPRSIVGQVGEGVAQLGVSRRGRCFVVCASRSLVVRRSTRRWRFSVFRSRFTSPRASRSPPRSARRVLLRCWPPVAAFPLR